MVQMLDCREKRAKKQLELIEKYGKPIACISMNIAGEVKRTPGIDLLFKDGCKAFEEALKADNLKLIHSEKFFEPTGNEGFYVCDTLDPATLKAAGMAVEEGSPQGRLFDIDIIDTNGFKLSRPVPRKCLVCGGPAADCARSRAHGLEAVKAATDALIAAYICKRMADSACNALKSEAELSPKPGLVDSLNNGAHRDMDLPLLLASAEALKPYFKAFAEEFTLGNHSIEKLIKIGVEAEKAMFKATGGVNTHKGAVFAFALYLAASAECCFSGADPMERVKELARDKAALTDNTATHGSLVRAKYGAKGAIDNGLEGFPLAHTAGAILYTHEDTDPQDARLYVLCRIMAELEDSNVLYRAGREGLDWVKKQAGNLCRMDMARRKERLAELNEEFVKRNISPGGAADMLALGIFLAEYGDLLYT